MQEAKRITRELKEVNERLDKLEGVLNIISPTGMSYKEIISLIDLVSERLTKCEESLGGMIGLNYPHLKVVK